MSSAVTDTIKDKLPGSSSELLFYINGKRYCFQPSAHEADMTLLEFLRSNRICLTGTKYGCGEGGCGACTVMLSRVNGENTVENLAINACLMPLVAIDHCAVVTVEGIGSAVTKLHPIQERLAKMHGSQCGFCTPGFIMSMYALLRNCAHPSEEAIEEAFSGNLCRCTGYRPITEAMRSVCDDQDKSGCCGGGSGGKCPCKEQGTDETGAAGNAAVPHDTEPIFPPELLRQSPTSLVVSGEEAVHLRPVTVKDLDAMLSACPVAKLVNGNTEVGIERRFKNLKYPVIIYTSWVHELSFVKQADGGIEVGSLTSLSNLKGELENICTEKEQSRTWGLHALLAQLRWFAGLQVRNVAAIGGNIVTASPISDLNPVLCATNAVLRVKNAATDSGRDVLASKFFKSYRKVDLSSGEYLHSIFVPWTVDGEYVHAYKQARRRDDDIAIVTAGMRVRIDTTTHEVIDSSFSFGGMAPLTVMAPETAATLRGKVLTDSSLFDAAAESLTKDLPLPEGAPGGMVMYRKSLTLSFLFKFINWSRSVLKSESENQPAAPETYSRDHTKSVQMYDERVNEGAAVGQSIPHASAVPQCTGEAKYTQDMLLPMHGVHVLPILSTRAHAKIVSIDLSSARSHPGFIDWIDSKDVPGDNTIGPIFMDELCIAVDTVTGFGQAVGAVVADTELHAVQISKLVRVDYEGISEPILTCEDAIARNSFFDQYSNKIERGQVATAFDECEYVVSGTQKMGGQEHFYLETNCTVVDPLCERDEFVVHASTQAPTKTQSLVARVLGVPKNRVVVKCKRMGGGFGGKETRSCWLSCIAALCAKKLRRPVKCTLDRDMDMVSTGGRHPFYYRYKAGFTKEGHFHALDIDLYNNAGWSFDLSGPVMDRALFHVDNAYRIPNVHVRGHLCKTNITSNTAFRGFGGPQGMFICETIMAEAAAVMKRSPDDLRALNLYSEGDLTHYNQTLVDCHLKRMWAECVNSSDYAQRAAAIQVFNQAHKYRKRGIAMVPTKYGMSFTAKFMNQAGALVHCYTDGSVLVTHGGCEMGQGLHTKITQIAATTLQVPYESVFISETSTDKVANTQPTAASVQTDLNGAAVHQACEEIAKRLKPFRDADPNASFADICTAAHFERVDLSAHGFYCTPDVGYDFATGEGKPFHYYNYGVAAAEVEIDVLTGDMSVLRADICMDVGRSLNPAIDIGQIEGAFVQGIGLFALEELVWTERGLFTQGPGTYKIPSINDVPIDFRVGLLKDAPARNTVYSSKGIGEPPLFLASAVFFAIQEAVKSYRADCGRSSTFVLESPATCERIRLACEDSIVEKAQRV